MNEEIVLVGGGGHAKVIISIIKKMNDFRIIGYTDPDNRGHMLGAEYLGGDDLLRQVTRDHPSAIAVIGIGMIKNSDARKRKQLFDLAGSLGLKLSPIISPDAVINESVKIGDGTVVMDGVVVNSGSAIGSGVILNTNCSVDHDCKISSFVHIAPGATLSGGVTVGENALIGAGSTVIEYKSIADNVIIGAGSVVVEDIQEPGTYFGNPARLST